MVSVIVYILVVVYLYDVTPHSYSTHYVSAHNNDNVTVCMSLARCYLGGEGLILQNTTKYSDYVLCLLNWCQINN